MRLKSLSDLVRDDTGARRILFKTGDGEAGRESGSG
jgi:hypothetical protein